MCVATLSFPEGTHMLRKGMVKLGNKIILQSIPLLFLEVLGKRVAVVDTAI